MKRPPKGASFEIIKMSKVDFIKGVLTRLEHDVGTILTLLENYNSSSPVQVGFWATLRMIMPIVEAVSHVDGISPQLFLERHLDVKTPNLTWDLFRHSLMHGDLIHHAKYGTKDVHWGVSLMEGEHIIGHNHIGLNVVYLYNKMRDYLKEEILKNDKRIVDIEKGIIYHNPGQGIVDDFLKL